MSSLSPPDRDLLIRVVTAVEHMANKLDSVHNIVTGGDTPQDGLFSKVQDHESRLTVHDKDREKRAGLITSLVLFTLTSVVSAIVALLSTWRGGGGPPAPHS